MTLFEKIYWTLFVVNAICERKSVTNSQLTELAADSSAKLWEAKEIIKKLLDFDFLPENEIKKQAERFLNSEETE